MKITVVPKNGKTVEFEDVNMFHPDLDGWLSMTKDDGSMVWYAIDRIEWFTSEKDEWDDAEVLWESDDDDATETE